MGVHAKARATKKRKNIPEMGEIVLYQSPGGKAGIDVHLKDETIWLNQFQMVELFERDQSVIARHIRNIFAEEELKPSERNMQKMHIPFSDKPVVYYSLDMIISVGYRVNSKRGTQFRIWATNVLRDHLLKGYTANGRRLKELRQSLQLVEHVINRHDVTSDEAKALLHVIMDYSNALDILD
ncbi:MAG: virulence RhuM family protein, partial [Ignavibacteriales bacterium]|nr:virulence RhuM family protein [Ignavibacteriales bacterium]